MIRILVFLTFAATLAAQELPVCVHTQLDLKNSEVGSLPRQKDIESEVVVKAFVDSLTAFEPIRHYRSDRNSPVSADCLHLVFLFHKQKDSPWIVRARIAETYDLALNEKVPGLVMEGCIVQEKPGKAQFSPEDWKTQVEETIASCFANSVSVPGTKQQAFYQVAPIARGVRDRCLGTDQVTPMCVVVPLAFHLGLQESQFKIAYRDPTGRFAHVSAAFEGQCAPYIFPPGSPARASIPNALALDVSDQDREKIGTADWKGSSVEIVKVSYGTNAKCYPWTPLPPPKAISGSDF